MEFLAMDGTGAYVWSAYGITLAAVVWNAWSARARLRKGLAEAAQSVEPGEPVRRPKVSEIRE
jgi:heme exporter protein CcmD